MISTRDAARTPRSYTDVLLEGLAPDGGLFVPSAYPSFSREELEALARSSYEDIAFAVKRLLVSGAIPDTDLRALINDAYAAPAFEREGGTPVPVTEIAPGLFLENLSLGPTSSFKDMALQLLGREMAYELAKRGESLTILGATSGDTGSAAEAAVKGLPNVRLFMLSPESGMSAFQRAQMGALSGGNIFNVSIRGRFDDCQDLVKDPAFANLGAVNSINWGRISSQIPYYFAGYFQVAKRVGDPIDVCVPSGNFGNMLSAYIAKRMGLPLRRLVVAKNENDVLDALFKTGVYQVKEARVTSSPSMDISKASNYERLAFDLFEGASRVTAYMEEFATTGEVSLVDYGASASSTHADRLGEIKRVYDESGVIIDPHTADGVHTGRSRMHEDGTPMLCVATALPVKFEDTVREALGFVPERPARFKGLETGMSDGSFVTMDADAQSLKAFVREKGRS